MKEIVSGWKPIPENRAFPLYLKNPQLTLRTATNTQTVHYTQELLKHQRAIGSENLTNPPKLPSERNRILKGKQGPAQINAGISLRWILGSGSPMLLAIDRNELRSGNAEILGRIQNLSAYRKLNQRFQ